MEADKEKDGYKPTIPIIRKPSSPRVPKDFGEYLVKDEVGCGGMGWIFKAVHKKLEVIRALKILDPRLSQHEEFLGNFKREAQLAAKLHHPNIVTIHNTGEFGGFHYIDMDFIEGDNLAKRLPEKGLDPLLVLAIAVKILDALDYAHNNEFSYQGQTYYGVTHRDIKPENIIIDSSGEVKITDFGIARGIHLYGESTAEGTVVGTPSYMSPEQIDGSQKISYTTDIYSLGVLMYELLSGKKAFPGTTTQIIKKISNHEYEPLAKLRKIPNDIIKIVDKAMSYSPEERFQSAYEMANVINRYLAQYQCGDPTTIIKRYFAGPVPIPPPPPSPVDGWWKKLRRVLASTAKVLGVIIVIFLVFIGLRYLYKGILRHYTGKALISLEEKLKQNQVKNASLDFGMVADLFDSAQVQFDSKNYHLSRIFSDSANSVLDRLLVLRREAIRTRYGEVSARTDSAKERGSEFDFRGIYLLPADSLIGVDEFDKADSILDKAFTQANDEIDRLKGGIREKYRQVLERTKLAKNLGSTVDFEGEYLVSASSLIEAREFEKANNILDKAQAHANEEINRLRPPQEKDLARRVLDEVKTKLVDAKRDCPQKDFSAEDSLIAYAQDLLNKSLFAQSANVSQEAGRTIAIKMADCLGIPPKVQEANEHYNRFSEKQKKDNQSQWERMNQFAKVPEKKDAAIALAQEILKIKPDVIPPPPEFSQSDSECLDIASNLDHAGDYNSALKYYEQVKPGSSKAESWKYYLPARFKIGAIYQEQKKEYKKAIAEYQKVLDLQNPNYYESCFLNIGLCFYEISSYDSAITYFEKVETYKTLIVPSKAKGEETIFDTDLWHNTMYFWASALTNLYYKEADPVKKKELKKAAIQKWENDYLDNYKKDMAHPRRGKFVRNADQALRNLKSED